MVDTLERIYENLLKLQQSIRLIKQTALAKKARLKMVQYNVKYHIYHA